MSYWVKRIVLKDGEVVTERELRDDENRFEGPAPVVGDAIKVECRGRKFMAEVIWGNWPGRDHSVGTAVLLRVAEIGLDPATPLRFPKLGTIPAEE
ncbi:MAG: hypothetical protein ACRYFW_05775 [Janthinobacterium lividum]